MAQPGWAGQASRRGFLIPGSVFADGGKKMRESQDLQLDMALSITFSHHVNRLTFWSRVFEIHRPGFKSQP